MFFWWFLGIFILYGVITAWYLFMGATTELPSQYKGTAADPTTFMTNEQLLLSSEFSRIKHLIFFLSIPLEWGIYLVVLFFGLAIKFRDLAKGTMKFSVGHTAIFVFLLSGISAILSFPLDYISYKVSQAYHISTQSFHSWMRDQVIGFWLGFLILFLVVSVIYFFMRKNEKRWWFYTWLVSIPFIIFMMYIQPVVIDPLYNDFYELKDKKLEAEILALADRADIPAERVFEVDMSKKTNAMNAYVTGIGSNLRIVLWDTTLNKLEDDEVLFIMAHEMGHYVMHHLYLNVLASIVLTFFGLWFGALLLRWFVKRFGKKFRIKGTSDLASLPALLLIFSLLSFLVSPIANATSRYHEHAADRYAIEMTENSDAAIGAFQQLTVTGLSEVRPPWLVKIFRYGHPTMLERIHFLETYEREG
jgi:STE24 endopeptidase